MKYLVIAMMIISVLGSCDKEILDSTDQISDEIYFPPLDSDEWDQINIDQLGWNENAVEPLLNFLEESDSRAFLLLKNGKIAIEHYWGNGLLNQEFTMKSNWYWASSAKSMTSFILGQAVTQGHIDIEDPSSKYLGAGWSSLSPELEENIRVKHHLSMTTGLDDSGDVHCTDRNCLTYKAVPGTRWSYHNGPYTILDQVIESATSQDFDGYFEENLKHKIGMDGFWTYQGYNHLYFSTPRSMARFGLLAMNDGTWREESLISEDYFKTSISSSQEINPSYGFLWWLNGKSNFMLPGSQLTFATSICQDAPSDMYAAIGKNSQLINIVPSENLVVIRMGGDPDESLVPTEFQNNMWRLINDVIGQ